MMLDRTAAVTVPAAVSLALTGTLLGIIALLLLPLVVVAHDRAIMKRVQPTSGWAAATIIGIIVFSVAVSNTAAAGTIVGWFL